MNPMKVIFRHISSEDWSYEVDLPNVPRIGEDVMLDEQHLVQGVFWYPADDEPWVLVQLR
jgi:hypothetical protein